MSECDFRMFLGIFQPRPSNLDLESSFWAWIPFALEVEGTVNIICWSPGLDTEFEVQIFLRVYKSARLQLKVPVGCCCLAQFATLWMLWQHCASTGYCLCFSRFAEMFTNPPNLVLEWYSQCFICQANAGFLTDLYTSKSKLLYIVVCGINLAWV